MTAVADYADAATIPAPAVPQCDSDNASTAPASARPSLLSRLADSKLLALADQGVVSATSFLTTILVGRYCGAEQLGLYSLAFGVTLLILTVQEAMVHAPYTVYWRRMPQSLHREYAGSTLIHWGVISAIAMAGLGVGCAAIAAGYGPPRLMPVLVVLMGAIPFLLLRDFARGYAYAHLRVRTALVLDATVSALQIAGLVTLAAFGQLSAAVPFAVIGVAGLISTSVWLWFRRHEFAIRWESAWRDWVRNWLFSRWVCAANVVTTLNSAVLLVWILAFLLGEAEAGIFAACETIVCLANPVILGINKILMPRMAYALADGGIGEMRREIRRTSSLLAFVIGAFCVVVGFWGEEIVRLAYGSEFLGHHQTIVAMAIGVLAIAVSLGPSKGLFALERPNVDLLACMIGLVTTLVTVVPLILTWGIFGAACSWCAGVTAMSVSRFVLFEREAKAFVVKNFHIDAVDTPELAAAAEMGSGLLLTAAGES